MADWPYNSERWQHLRRKQLKAEPLCRACWDQGRASPGKEVDHIRPISQGGAVWSLENLQSLCSAHHSLKTAAYDRQGKSWTRWELRGCFADGSPRDPEHPDYTGGPGGKT
jgi:5-methylcytosine-specific restriction protein A